MEEAEVRFVLAYLAAIVAANLAIATFGPVAAIPVAFVLVGLDFVCRDALHDLWRGYLLWPRMLLLIAAGGLISFAVNADAATIAVASTIAFAASSIADAVVYQLLGRRRWLERANGSNLVGAAVDSMLFPTLAFGAFLPVVVVGQFAAKVAGGAVWSYLLRPRLVVCRHPGIYRGERCPYCGTDPVVAVGVFEAWR